MTLRYKHETSIGTFYIGELKGRFHPVYDGDSLGDYQTAQQAVDDLVGGHTFSLGSGVDTSALDIPDDLTAWDLM